jgi:hypothetical protein
VFNKPDPCGRRYTYRSTVGTLMRWHRTWRPRWWRSSPPPAFGLTAFADGGPELPRHLRSIERGEGISWWRCSCGEGGGEQPGSTIEQQIMQHHFVTTVALLPLVSPRQLVEALRRGVTHRAPSQHEAVELLISHQAWLSDARLRTFLRGGWSSTGDLTAVVDWRRVAYALGVVDELLFDIKLLGAPLWMQPHLDDWTGLREQPPLIGEPEHDRGETAVLRACAAIAGATTLDLHLVSAEVDPPTRSLIARAVSRCIVSASPSGAE